MGTKIREDGWREGGGWRSRSASGLPASRGDEWVASANRCTAGRRQGFMSSGRGRVYSRSGEEPVRSAVVEQPKL